VHTISDWWDGARKGIADFNGHPHYYECQFNETKDDWSNTYSLHRIDDETFRLALEDWQIWRRWRTAFDEHKATIETHPALPADRERHDVLARLLKDMLVITDGDIQAVGAFKYGEPTRVRWMLVS
jgi:hypothetical protein